MTHHRDRRAGARRTVALIALTLACGLMPGHPFARFEPTARAAATFVVTNTGDFGPGSLRQAIPDATAANFGPGVSILSSNNVIGGTTPAARNVISGNSDAGVQLELFCCTGTNPTASGNVIQGNYIGLNAAGTAALPNQREGVVIT